MDHALLPYSTSLAMGSINRNDVILDSGCSQSTFSDLSRFTTFTKADMPPMEVANGQFSSPQGHGMVYLAAVDPYDNNAVVDWTIENAQYCPDCPVNLLSQGSLRHLGYKINDDTIHLKNTAVVILDWYNNVAVVVANNDEDPSVATALNLATVNKANNKVTLELMHKRLCHAGKSRVLEACHRVGITFPQSEIDTFHCEACHLGKSHQLIKRYTHTRDPARPSHPHGSHPIRTTVILEVTLPPSHGRCPVLASSGDTCLRASELMKWLTALRSS
ncbi:hypothetical protein LY78DRAFT_675022 [Colletotrichum sublineola]|nr:hypothetical protein LY78DRAFT_675022 [Colletotrichum sublineola]